MVGERRTIAVSSDGGRTWADRSTIVTGDLWDVTGAPGGDIYAVGDDNAVIRSSDQGRTFEVMRHQKNAASHRTVWASGSEVFVAGNESERVLHSRDRGATFANEPTGAPTGDRRPVLRKLWGRSAKDVFAAGGEGTHGGASALFHTKGDGTWTAIPVEASEIFGVRR